MSSSRGHLLKGGRSPGTGQAPGGLEEKICGSSSRSGRTVVVDQPFLRGKGDDPASAPTRRTPSSGIGHEGFLGLQTREGQRCRGKERESISLILSRESILREKFRSPPTSRVFFRLVVACFVLCCLGKPAGVPPPREAFHTRRSRKGREREPVPPLHAWRAGGRGSRPAFPGRGASPRRPAASPGGRRSPGPSPARPAPARPSPAGHPPRILDSPPRGAAREAEPEGRAGLRRAFARRRQPRGDPSPDPEAERRGRARAAPRWRRGTWPWCGPTGRRRG